MFVALLASVAQAQEPAPCAGGLTAPVKPCAQPSDRPATQQAGKTSAAAVVATIDGAPITVADLDEATRKTIEGLDAALAEARRKALREEANDLLIAREARRRGIGVGRLLDAEVRSKVTHPTSAEVAAEIAAHPDKYKNGMDDAEWVAGTLYDRRLAAREKEFIAALEKRSPAVKPKATLYVDTAVADVRIEAMTAEREAVEQAIHDRLLRAEAQRQGITPEELTERELTSKLTPPSEAEMRATWERMKSVIGDDFDKVRNDISQYLTEQKKSAAAKAFDDRLRAGHQVSIQVDIPKRPAQKIAVERSPIRGPRAAKVTLVEFGDFECSPCGRMWGVVDEALRPYEGRVRYVFRQFPLSFHPFAWKAAEAALAAHAQGKFFPYAHILFTHQAQLDLESLKRYAGEAGLDRKKFDDDLDSGRFAADVILDKRTGLRAGVLGTPMFFLNGELLGQEGYTPDGMRAAIENALASTAK